ncbi:MAG: glycosyltransferase family 2 protein [Caldilineaceae bacterium]|nr:glycosyltransferase family 2 protein [Caldilineaceae bacterium]
MPKATAIIPLWNGEQWIRPCLTALARQREGTPFALEVIVVDNGSVDRAPAIVQSEFPDARLIRNSRNLGFAGGCNVGLAAATGDLLVLLNQDTLVQPGWLAGLARALNDPQVGIAGSLALLPDGATVQHAGGIIDWPLGIARHRGQGESLAGPWKESAEVAFVTAASLAMRREVWEKIGSLDEGFGPGYYEDVDLCLRAQAAGYGVVYAPASRLLHSESGSFTDSPFTRWARLRGRLRFCLKHLPPQRFLHEFLPAEADYQPTVLAGDRQGQVARAYLEAIPMVLELWHSPAATDEIRERAILSLCRLCPPLTPATPPAQRIPPPGQPLLTPSPLDRIPLLGRLRRGLHQLAIFYAERRERELLALLEDQQEAIDRLQKENARLRERPQD